MKRQNSSTESRATLLSTTWNPPKGPFKRKIVLQDLSLRCAGHVDGRGRAMLGAPLVTESSTLINPSKR